VSFVRVPRPAASSIVRVANNEALAAALG